MSEWHHDHPEDPGTWDAYLEQADTIRQRQKDDLVGQAEYLAEKRRLLDRLGEDAPSHESNARLRMRAEWNEDEERMRR